MHSTNEATLFKLFQVFPEMYSIEPLKHKEQRADYTYSTYHCLSKAVFKVERNNAVAGFYTQRKANDGLHTFQEHINQLKLMYVK